MSGHVPCTCGARAKPMAQRPWFVLDYMCNYSAFNGYHHTYSEYSSIQCLGANCTGSWRTKAAYVEELTRFDFNKSQDGNYAAFEEQLKDANNN